MKYFLLILDGWGLRDDTRANAVAAARTPTFDHMMAQLPHIHLVTCGERVGLPEGIMGNSEVGHLNIGAGRVVWQEMTRINRSIREGSFFQNPVLLDVMHKARGSRLHLMGLLSDGGVHSHQEHLYALLKMARQKGVEQVFIHALMDGRDTPPKAGQHYMRQLLDKIEEIGVGRVATISGRYYTMDRDKRWDRTEKAYAALVYGEGRTATDPVQAIVDSYAADVTDEFIQPVVMRDGDTPVATMEDGDVVLFFNFRADRARQISRALNDPDFDGFQRRRRPDLHYFTFTEYDATFHFPICFPPQTLKNILAAVFARNGIHNLRMAETEKYAHVTFFFNGGVEEPWPGERRVLIPSPKVATYDLQPEMSAGPVTDRLLQEIDSNQDDVFIVNYANADMVGHTGIMDAAVKAVETVDTCLGRIFEKVREIGACLIVTADHGNSETLVDPETGGPHTAHTLNPVPFIVYHPTRQVTLRDDGSLENIAPTLLDLMGIEKPAEMTGTTLLL